MKGIQKLATEKGFTVVASFDDDQLDIMVSHTGTSPAAIGLACPDRAVQTTPVAFQPYLWQFRFRLSDEGEQTTTTQVFTAKLTPK